jgi:hypothetical protein
MMQKITLLFILFVTITISSQEKRIFEKEVLKISKRIDLITTIQKDSLKMKVISIDKKLQKGEITITTANILKKEIAMYHAKQIETKVGEQEGLLQLLVQDKTDGKFANAKESGFNDDAVNTFKVGSKTFRFTVKEDDATSEKGGKENSGKQKRKSNRSTTSQFLFAMGTNNVLQDHKLSSLSDSEFKFWKSRFYELGFTWKTRLRREASELYFKYGVSFLWNNLRLDDNQYFLKNGEMTDLQVFSRKLIESRLRHVQMSFPLHLEWDFSKNKKYKDGFVFDKTNESVRVGLGGFVAFKLGTRQYLEYENSRGVKVEEVQYDNFNMNTVNYGLSAYAGYKATSLYVKYDLNPLFKDTEMRNISLGIRFDLN